MAATGVDDVRLTRVFLEEAEELAGKLGDLLGGAGADASDPERINEIFRIVHSLKSEAAAIGFTRLAGLAHRMEDVLGLVRSGTRSLAAEVLAAIVDGADAISGLIAGIARGEGDVAVDTDSILAALDAIAGPARGGEAAAGRPQPTVAGRRPPAGPGAFTEDERARVREAIDRGESLHCLTFGIEASEPMKYARAYLVVSGLEETVPVVRVEPSLEGEPEDDEAYARVTVWFTSGGDGREALPLARVDQVVDPQLSDADAAAILAPATPGVERHAAAAVRAPAEAAVAPDGRTSIRVDTRRLDELWTLVAELVQQKARLATITGRLSRAAGLAGAREDLDDAFDGLEKISGGMQQVMMETRMVPISVILGKFPRLVRELSRQLGKSVELEVVGGDTEIDRGIVEVLSEPLTHIVRNAVDHGIEYPEERVRQGKGERGRVTIAASQQGGRIVIEVADDGRGMDPELIRRRALALGIPGAEGFDERRLLELVFLPGFSTREVVTQTSGRGVGLDIVANRVRSALKGEVRLDTAKGEGTRVSLLLPLTLTIVRALLVRGGEDVCAVPLSGVDATTTVVNTEIRGSGEELTWVFQDEELPLTTLRGLLGRGAHPAEEHAAVIVRRGAARGCLVVDELLEERELVIKPLDDLANAGRLFSGVAVREDGSLVYILDTSFVREGGTRREAAWVPAS